MFHFALGNQRQQESFRQYADSSDQRGTVGDGQGGNIGNGVPEAFREEVEQKDFGQENGCTIQVQRELVQAAGLDLVGIGGSACRNAEVNGAGGKADEANAQHPEEGVIVRRHSPEHVPVLGFLEGAICQVHRDQAVFQLAQTVGDFHEGLVFVVPVAVGVNAVGGNGIAPDRFGE